MGKHEKLIKRFASCPKDFSWRELEAMLRGFGYKATRRGKTGGSRIRFVHDELPSINLHKPHPSNILKRYQIQQIEEFLCEEGLL
ncbi:MAG TPA: type II toxin-antitoxin system HicA family toxin [Nitrospirae bacterium]|nr:type II toxin-antitoxin system HicA family toxin [Nitrospirota bacterium]